MNNEDFVSYEIARALKKAGFDLTCDRYWYQKFADSDNMTLGQASADDFNNDDWDVPHCSAPSLWQAQKWLREKGYAIEPRVWLIGSTREYRPYIMPPKKRDYIALSSHDTYESALSSGIEAALKLINTKTT